MKRGRSITINDLSAESLAHVSSYVLDYSSITREIAKPHRAVTTVSKAFRSSAIAVMDAFVHHSTDGRWTRAPTIIFRRAFEDGTRLGIPGLSQKAALECLVPKAVLDNLPKRTYPLARRRVAYSFQLGRIFQALSALYPTHVAWETALEVQQARLQSIRVRREDNLRVRESRRREIRALWSTTIDERVERLYIQNGSAKNLEILKTLAGRLQQLENVGVSPTDNVASHFLKTGADFDVIKAWASTKQARDRISADLGRLGIRSILPVDIRYADENLAWESLIPIVERASAVHARIEPLWALLVPLSHWCRASEDVRLFVLEGAGDVQCIDAALASVSDFNAFKALRKAELVAGLRVQNLELRGDSNFCKQYINGTTNACMDEVVATMWLTGQLFDQGGPRMWSASHHACETAMRKSMKDGSASTWMEAARRSLIHAIEDEDEW